MNKDLADKAAKKWVEQGGDKMDADARAWIEALTGTKLEGTTQEALKSGNILCELVNVIKPGSCPAPSKMSAPFKQMENIGNYLKACEGLGLRDAETFQTVSLYEDQDMLQVLVQIHSLGRIAQAIGFEGPTLGPKISEENKREFTAAQLAASAGQATKLGMGSSTAPAAGMKTAELLGSNIVRPAPRQSVPSRFVRAARRLPRNLLSPALTRSPPPASLSAGQGREHRRWWRWRAGADAAAARAARAGADSRRRRWPLGPAQRGGRHALLGQVGLRGRQRRDDGRQRPPPVRHGQGARRQGGGQVRPEDGRRCARVD